MTLATGTAWGSLRHGQGHGTNEQVAPALDSPGAFSAGEPPQADLLDVGLGAGAGGEVESPEALGGARAGCVHVNSGPGRTSFSDMHFLGF